MLIRWISTFCSDRKASIIVNRELSQQEGLPHAGIPQRSPLSSILFLFFNADLVQRRINSKGGAVAFIDDYTIWAIGNSAAFNCQELENLIQHATEWERRSGATFEPDKTTVIHFTRNPRSQIPDLSRSRRPKSPQQGQQRS